VRALTFHPPGDIRFETVADPTLEAGDDAIVHVERAGICGSDLHVVHGRERALDPGSVMGHEFVGRVVATGAGLTRLAPGDRVVAAFTTCCGACFYCRRGLSARCPKGRLFGWVEGGIGLQGGQAEYVRVPMADATLFPLPQDMAVEAAVLLADVLPTGWHCARMAEVGPGSVAVVIGCGPVGLMAVAAANELGAARVFAVDTVAERLAAAARFGAVPLRLELDDIGQAVRDATEGRGADALLEAVGSSEAARLGFELVRPGGVISIAGVHHEPRFEFSPAEAYDRNLTLRIGRCPARSLMPELLPVLQRRPELASIVTHRRPLADGVEAYRLFDRKEDGCIKVVLEP
jgi:threonine dehydrogenase-like Zn-dependent dehydrogenase